MPNSSAFEWMCDALESNTPLDRLQARGTIRLALRQAGLAAGAVTVDQLAVVLKAVMPGELTSRAVDGAADLCARLAAELTSANLGDLAKGRTAPEDIFRRLAQS